MNKLTAFLLLPLVTNVAFAQQPNLSEIDPNNSEFIRSWGEIFDATWPLKTANHTFCSHEVRYLPGFMVMGMQTGRGVSVFRVAQGSPAEDSGLRVGDIITSMNGNPINHKRDKKLAEQFSDAYDDAVQEDEPMVLTVDRDGSPLEITIQSVPACDIQIFYTGQPMPTMVSDNVILIGSKLDQYAANPEQLRMYIARDFASIMLKHEKERSRKATGYNLLGGLVGAVTGGRTPSGDAIASWREGPRQAIEADRMGLLLVARAGDDITLAPAYWQGVFASDRTNPVLGRLLNNPAGSPERLEAIKKTTERILALQAAGEALEPDALKDDDP